MEVRFSIDIVWKISLKTNQSPRKLEFMDLPHGILFFQGTPGILHPFPCMDIKWNSPLLGRNSIYPVGALHHYMFIICQLWLTSHPRGTVVLLDTGTPTTSRETYSEDANDGTRTRNPSVKLDKLISFPAIAFETFSSMARTLSL